MPKIVKSETADALNAKASSEEASIGITIPMMMEQLIKMQASQVQMQADTKEQFQEISEHRD